MSYVHGVGLFHCFIVTNFGYVARWNWLSSRTHIDYRPYAVHWMVTMTCIMKFCYAVKVRHYCLIFREMNRRKGQLKSIEDITTFLSFYIKEPIIKKRWFSILESHCSISLAKGFGSAIMRFSLRCQLPHLSKGRLTSDDHAISVYILMAYEVDKGTAKNNK